MHRSRIHVSAYFASEINEYNFNWIGDLEAGLRGTGEI
jgi:hypothetical protein